MSTPKLQKGSARLAELDGLRALAVVSVILFHCDITGVANAGFFGVDMFFTISGFIISAILLEEVRSQGEFDFPNFYFRRLKRLLPPMLGLIAIAFVGTALVDREALRKFVADAPAALLYWSNWWQILDKQDYFDTTPHVLRHLWSLAVEEQFYFVWPPLAYFVLKRGGAKAAGMLAVAGTVASTAWMWHLYLINQDAIDQNRIYLGSDTHAMGLLAGAALACFWNPWNAAGKGRVARACWRALALAALGALGLMAARMNFASPWLYRGAFLAIPVLTCVVIHATMGDRAFFVSALLRNPAMQWLGLRSYALYLVHWPVFVWMRLCGHDDFAQWTVLLPALACVLLGAELMYRFVELPFKKYDLRQAGARPKLAAIGGYTAIALAFSVAITLAGVEPAARMAVKGAGPAAPMAAALRDRPAPARPAPAVPQGAPYHAPEEDPAEARIRIAGGQNMYALGDSVLLGAQEQLQHTIPGIQVDAAVGRQARQGLKIVKEWHVKLAHSSTVLVHLGTNGYIDEGEFRELLKGLAVCRSVILVNVHADRRWTAPNNELIARMIHEFPNTRLVDWSQVSAQRPDFFVKDGIHLTRRGILAFTSQIRVATGGELLPEMAPVAQPGLAKAIAVAHKAAGFGTKAGATAPAVAPAVMVAAAAATPPALGAAPAAGDTASPYPAAQAQPAEPETPAADPAPAAPAGTSAAPQATPRA